jgi:hypothetical protein
MAQEKIVLLREGGTVWDILVDQGCSQRQVAVLWPLVVKDSGLDPANDRDFPAGSLIAIRRDCDGQSLDTTYSDLRTENLELKERLGFLQKQLQEAREEIDVLLNASASQAQDGLAISLLAAFLIGGLGGALFLKKFQKRELPPADDFPKQVPVEHNGQVMVFNRVEDPSRCKVFYQCPVCQNAVALPEKCEKHLREQHATDGKVDWEDEVQTV